MTSSSKGQTENTPQSSSEESTGAKVQPSEPLASSDNTQPSTTTTHRPLKPTKSAVPGEKVLSAVDLAKASLQILERNGLIRRFKIWNKDQTAVRAVVIVFDNTHWTPDLDLKALSKERWSE